MRILILANYDLGLYKFRKELIEELLNLGHEIYISLPDDKNLDEINAYSVKECVDSLGITKNTINVKITSSQNEIKLFAITPNKKRHNRGVKYAFPSAKAFPQTSSGKGGKPKSHSRKTSYSSISELISFEPGHGTGRNKK